ncbi:MAG: PilZ domain-containing protein [Planctomycetota bacterium]
MSIPQPDPHQPTPTQPSTHPFKLVSDRPVADVGPLRFERRRAPRHDVLGRLTIYGLAEASGDQPPHAHISWLDLRNRSALGLAGTTRTRFARGTTVTVVLPPDHFTTGGPHPATVARCDDNGDGSYTLGLELTPERHHAA